MLFLSHIPFRRCHRPASPHNRRSLHQPLFPVPISSPPSNAPSLPPSSPSFPKYPSSTNPRPFFPFIPSPPPPSSSSSSTPSAIPSLPGNISSLINPSSSSAPQKSDSKKLVPAVLLPIFSVAVIVVAVFYFVSRRKKRYFYSQEKSVLSDNRRLFPPNTTTSDGRKLSASTGTAATSDFLFLGTVVNSRGGGTGTETTADGSSASIAVGSPYRKLGSPELHPLPPLPRQSRHVYVNAEGGGSSDEEFYSPTSFSAEKEGPRGLLGRQESGSRRAFGAPVVEKLASRKPNLTSPSYPCSTSASSPTPPSSPPRSSPPVSSSPTRSPVKSLSSRSENFRLEVVAGGFHPPPPPPIRPLTPSPPKRRPPSPSPPSSPPDKDSDKNLNLIVSDISGDNVRSPIRTVDFTRNPFVVAPPPPPPPPPPLPPVGYWESKSPKVVQPPVLIPPRPIGAKNYLAAAAVFPVESPRNSDDVDRSNNGTPRPKLKPLHWDKVRASSDRVMVWDQQKSSSFQLNEEMIETLFMCNAPNTTPKETPRRQVLPSLNQENRVLDPKKSQNIAILLRALNVTKEEVCEALLEGNTDSMGAELLETLLKMAPSEEEEMKLQEYRDDSPFKLGPAEKFLKAMLNIPFAFKRVEAMLYCTNFDSEVSYLSKSFQTLETACDELRKSRMFMKLLEAVLKTGYRMNVGTNRGDAHAFKLDTLLKLVDVKGTDGKTTLLHFVVQEIIRAEGSRISASNQTQSTCTFRDELELKRLGLQVVSGLIGELSNVKKAAAMDSDVLSSYVSKLAAGIGKVNDVTKMNSSAGSREIGRRFHESMGAFLKIAEDEIIRVQAQESVALSLVKQITEYFHGNSTREEAHPFRIFMVVRDFLSTLDQVCKEVGKINERSIVCSARQFTVPINPTLAPVFPRFQPQRMSGSSGDDDDDTSSSSS